MRPILRSAVSATAILSIAACSGLGGSPSAPGTTNAQSVSQAAVHSLNRDLGIPSNGFTLPANVQRACNDFRPGVAHCDALIRTDLHGVGPDVPGLYAASLEAAYNLPSTGGSGQVVGIVDAYDNPDVATDIAEYRSFMGLSTANFTKYNQTGQQSNYPQGNEGWGVEIALDVEMVSAACPNCTIILVEANSANWSDLQTAEQEAFALGATVVSNSYSGSGATQSYFTTNKGVILASAGDSGYGIADPADFDTVVAVGGTTLTKGGGGSRGWTETVWSGTGSGCSKKSAKPAWQTDTGCKNRTVGDIAYVADPDTGVAVYDTYGGGGWTVYGGTSVSSPAIAAMFAAAGNASSIQNAGWIWEAQNHGASELNDITSGSNGTCKVPYLCTGEVGYDGPTGWGTPNGLSGL